MASSVGMKHNSALTDPLPKSEFFGTTVHELLALDFTQWDTQTISSGSITITETCNKIIPEGGAGNGADNLDTISFSGSNVWLVILIANDPINDPITIRHGIGNINCWYSTNYTMNGLYRCWVGIYRNDDSSWIPLIQTPSV